MKNVVYADRLVIDVAVLCEQTNEIVQTGNDHIVNLDDILLTQDNFKKIFYSFSENFGIDNAYINANADAIKAISFLPDYRTVNKKKFYLVEQIVTNLESDLNVPRNCFTVDSLVELTNQLINVKSLTDINISKMVTSLNWTNIADIIYNYKLLKNTTNVVNPICCISVIFKTPTVGVGNTVVRFNYKLIDI
jgi:hypothetical protein